MTLKLYRNFKKRHNSTKQPSGNGENVDVFIKQNTSIENPSFILSGNLLEMNDVNYCEWNGQFYFVSDIISLRNNMVELRCNHDILATHKNDIGSLNCFIARASSEYDALITDDFISQKMELLDSVSVISEPMPNYLQGGTYLVRTAGKFDNASSLGITTYAMNITTLRSVLDFIFDENNFADIFVDQTVKATFNPFQYIISVKWFPLNPSVFGSQTESVKFGWWDTGISATVVTATGFNTSFTVGIPVCPYNDFRAYDSRWTKYNLFLPVVGNFPINGIDIKGTENNVALIYYVDFATGECLVRIMNGNRTQIGCTNGQMGVDIAIGQLALNVNGALNNVTNGIQNLMMGNIVGGVGDLFQGAQNVLQPIMSTNGSAGNMSFMRNFPYAIATMLVYDGKSFPYRECGRPLCEYRTISTLSGYIQCQNASIDIDGLENDRISINNYLNGGFYYE